MMYKEAEAIFGNLPAIAQNILESDPEETGDEEDEVAELSEETTTY